MATKKTAKKEVTKASIITAFMDHVLTKEEMPKSIYKFCKEQKITETDFYQHFSSFQHLQEEIWVAFYEHSWELINKDNNFDSYDNENKMLVFLYTFFEVLTANRSYVLYVLPQNKKELQKLSQLKHLRIRIKLFAKELIENRNENAKTPLGERSPKIYAEGAWLQVLFLMNYWRNDRSPSFEKTDIAIEKSVRAIFDVFDTSPFQSVLDLGKFLWKEQNI
ncbi:MAG: TetR/AcrR family transcriptional regulator [Flavobacteriaceae bacterium]|nr:TetR/AcrR family transcriptional regulator [Flavobacteriaceae bacterium]